MGEGLSVQEVDQCRDERRIGRRHRISAQILGENPFQLLVFPRNNKTLPAAANIKRHEKMELFIREARESERRKAGFLDKDPELLVQFPNEGLLRPLIHFDFAAREFPKTREGLSFRTLRDQYAAICVDQSDGGNEQ